jgi:hypothetical protein
MTANNESVTHVSGINVTHVSGTDQGARAFAAANDGIPWRQMMPHEPEPDLASGCVTIIGAGILVYAVYRVVSPIAGLLWDLIANHSSGS